MQTEKNEQEQQEQVEAPVEESKAEEQIAVEVVEEEKPKVELTDQANKIMDSIKNLTVLELSNLVKALEDEFGVSAQPTMVAGAGFAPAAGAAAGGAAAEEEKTNFDVILASAGDKKIQVIKEIRGITSLGLKEAKELVDSAPKPVKEGASKEEADEIKAKLEAVGATVELK